MTDTDARLIERAERTCGRAEGEFPKLVAPDGTAAIQFTDLRALIDLIKSLSAEVARLRGDLANIGMGLNHMPYRNNGGALVSWNKWAESVVRAALGDSK